MSLSTCNLAADLLDHASYRALADLAQGLVDAFSGERAGFKRGYVQPLVQIAFELRNRQQRDVGFYQVAFVILEYERHLPNRESLVAQVLHEVIQAFDIFIFLHFERVGDENDAVNPSQYELSGGVVHDLAGNGVELDANGHVEHFADIEGQKVEEKGPVSPGVDGDHFAANLSGHGFMNIEQICGLPPAARAVVDYFCLDFVLAQIYECHELFPSGPPNTMPISFIALTSLSRIRPSETLSLKSVIMR